MVGIGGIGMSGIAVVLNRMGIRVSGSDLSVTEITRRLQNEGVIVYQGHNAANLHPDVELMVVSSAIPPDNPEVQAAGQMSIPIIKRGEMLARLLNKCHGIAIAGAHGKTTTTSMISSILEHGDLDPTFIIGGELQESRLNAKLGQGRYLIAEADESDASFLGLYPYVAVVTNVSDDHLDHYGSVEKIRAAFHQFVSQVRPDGFSLLYSGDKCLAQLRNTDSRILYYGADEQDDYYYKDIRSNGIGSVFQVYRRGIFLGEIQLRLPGVHNVLNALAAVAVGYELGVEFDSIRQALRNFSGARRRFEVVGKMNGITVIDDYAHHPVEIEATIDAARQFHNNRLIVIFQPHRYSRTQLLGSQFQEVFQDSDVVIITDIYAAGEKPIPGVSGELIYNSVQLGGCNAIYIPNKDDVVDYLMRVVQSNDLIITMGAGDIWQTGTRIVEELFQKFPQA
ncbi:MAG: UDP-N-acetylmuramate--L-alanine ligase [Syntrophomonadaceae bacterium]|jgi:UDP-N-acetylmuramate--alanine ligase|nr:UDP-N-acetylmuramate--L-alanine ligase [Syntrophomonadaceae bacterium]